MNSLTEAIRAILIREAAGTLDPTDTAETVAASEYVRGMADLIYRVTGGDVDGDDGVAAATAEIVAAIPIVYGQA